MRLIKNLLFPLLSLAVSAGALVSGAIPAIFEASGYGEKFADFAAKHPDLLWLSKFKFELFMTAGVTLFLLGLLQLGGRTRTGAILFLFSLFIFLAATYFGFIAPETMLKDHP
jgi:hypothetical protein